MLARSRKASYEELREGFAWQIPEHFNIGVACSDRHPAGSLALVDLDHGSGRREYTFGELSRLSNRLANALRALGVGVGDRVAIVLPQRVETGVAHLAIYKLGAIAVPMSVLFGPDALRHRLSDSGASVVITDAAREPNVTEAVAEHDGVRLVLVDRPSREHRGFWELLQDADESFGVEVTGPDTPALLIYTSGTTGSAKGALHGHRALIGHLPGFELSHDFFPQEGDLFWTPADWAWIGGLMDALLPSWYHGRPVVAATRERFDPEWALRVMVDERVRNAFLPPTALKLIRQAGPPLPGIALRSAMSGGEPLGGEMLAWAREYLGVTISEIYGQTEANYVVGNCAGAWEVRPGSMGRPYPGHEVAVLRTDGSTADLEEEGEIAVAAPDPVLFLRYWNQPEATRGKFDESGRWLRTGDLATADPEGYLWFAARKDDVINSAGYRIGPAEIEDCLISHPAVEMAAVIGVPDEVRGEAVKAFVKLADGQSSSSDLEDAIREHVRRRLAAYLYPRHVEFVDELPLTTTGKIRRAELRRTEAEGRGAGT